MNPLLKKITELNKAALHFVADENNVSIVKDFTEESK